MLSHHYVTHASNFNFNFRAMTLTEKQQLCKLIQKLPPKNLDRVVEIIQHGKLAEPQSCGEIFVDLEKEVNHVNV